MLIDDEVQDRNIFVLPLFMPTICLEFNDILQLWGDLVFCSTYNHKLLGDNLGTSPNECTS